MKNFSQIRLEQAINLIVDENKPIREISIRCPYCGDSRRRPGATHLGIKFGNPSIWHCFRCSESGVVSPRFLNDVGIDKKVIKKYARWQKLNRYKSAPSITEISFSDNKEVYGFEYLTESPQYKYITERFGVELSEEDVKKYRIILDPNRFLKRLSYVKERKVKAPIDLSNYIGFLTQDGNQAIFRALDKEKEPRYFNFTIEKTDYRKLYLIDNEIDIKQHKFNFILTEGIFDLIGVHEKFYKNQDIDLSNHLFVAVLGKSFSEPINRLIRSGFLDFNIILYADSSEDIDIEFFNELFKNEYIDEILVVRNIKEGEKDFGVHMDNIEPDYQVIDRKVLRQLNIKSKKKE